MANRDRHQLGIAAAGRGIAAVAVGAAGLAVIGWLLAALAAWLLR